MTVLSFITIRGLAWTVCEEHNPTVDEEPVYGYCDREARRIVVAASATGLIRARTLIHEICHATSEDISEELVEALEEAIGLGLSVIGYNLEKTRGENA